MTSEYQQTVFDYGAEMHPTPISNNNLELECQVDKTSSTLPELVSTQSIRPTVMKDAVNNCQVQDSRYTNYQSKMRSVFKDIEAASKETVNRSSFSVNSIIVREAAKKIGCQADMLLRNYDTIDCSNKQRINSQLNSQKENIRERVKQHLSNNRPKRLRPEVAKWVVYDTLISSKLGMH